MSERSVSTDNEEEEQCVYSFTEHRGDICCVSQLVIVILLVFSLQIDLHYNTLAIASRCRQNCSTIDA